MLLTCLRRRVSQYLRVLGPCFHYRHQLVFSWLLVLHLIYGERATLKTLARHGPAHLAYQHYRRLLCAAYWCTKTLLWRFVDQALQAFPPLEYGILHVAGDSTLKGKRGQQHLVAHKTRLSHYHPYVFWLLTLSSWRSGTSIASPWISPWPHTRPIPPTKPTMPCFDGYSKRSNARRGAKRSWWQMQLMPPGPIWS